MRPSSETVARSSGSDRVLVIMAKAPRPGAVKTRLTTSLSPEAVTAFYCCLLDDTLALARSLSDVDVAIMCPVSDVNELGQLAGNGVGVVAQKGEGLAAGLTSVFAHFATPRGQHDVVVGPTHDGGYYLVGAKAAHPALFNGDGMSTKSALDALLARAHGLQL